MDNKFSRSTIKLKWSMYMGGCRKWERGEIEKIMNQVSMMENMDSYS